MRSRILLLLVCLGVGLIGAIYLNLSYQSSRVLILPTDHTFIRMDEVTINPDLLGRPKRITKNNLKDPEWLKNFLKNGCSPNCLRYPIFVTSLTRKSSRLPRSLRTMSEYIVRKINENFEMENGKKIVKFYLKGYSGRSYRSHRDARKCEKLVRMGDGEIIGEDGHKYYPSSEWSEAFLNCRLKSDKKSLNVYIYDAYSSRNNSSDKTGRGFPNRGDEFQSMVLIDYQRLIDDYNGEEAQSPFAHEVGHSFTLGHVCDLNARRPSDDTNLMASAGSIAITSDHSVYSGNNGISYDCPNSGGNRDQGLTSAQTITVLEAIVKQKDYWLEAVYY